MKKIFLILIFLLSYTQAQYTFIIKKYSKEIELEAKIIANISKAITNKNAKIFIPKMKEKNYPIYANYLNIVRSCEEAELIYIKDSIKKLTPCKNQNKLYFTNNYKILLSEQKFIGAFFWSKSRPNIVFIKNRLEKNKIVLPQNYTQFVEEDF